MTVHPIRAYPRFSIKTLLKLTMNPFPFCLWHLISMQHNTLLSNNIYNEVIFT